MVNELAVPAMVVEVVVEAALATARLKRQPGEREPMHHERPILTQQKAKRLLGMQALGHRTRTQQIVAKHLHGTHPHVPQIHMRPRAGELLHGTRHLVLQIRMPVAMLQEGVQQVAGVERHLNQPVHGTKAQVGVVRRLNGVKLM